MKQKAVFVLLFFFAFTGCSNSEKTAQTINYVDTFHQQVDGLILNLTPPDTWQETLCSYEVAYSFLDHKKLETILTPNVTSQLVNLRDKEAGDPDYFMEILSGSDGMCWAIRENTPATSTQSSYVYGNEEPFTLDRVFTSGVTQQIEDAVDIASDFLRSIGINDVELHGYNKSEDTVLMRFSYAGFDGIPAYDSSIETDWTPFVASDFDVAVVENSVRYASITFPYKITSAGESKACLSPEQATKYLIEWYTEMAAGEEYSFNTISMCWAIASNKILYGKVDTASLSPYWLFYGTHGENHEFIAVDAITGEVFGKTQN